MHILPHSYTIQRLPPEILCLVFRALPATDRILCSHVCAYWHAVALANVATVWSYIDLRKPWFGELDALLERARHVPVHVDMKVLKTARVPSIMAILSAHMFHIRCLEITYEGIDCTDGATTAEIEALLYKLVTPAPILEELFISAHPFEFLAGTAEYAELPDNFLGGHAPRLRSVHLNGVIDVPNLFPRLAAFTEVQHLEFRTNWADPLWLAAFLAHFPALRTIALCADITQSHPPPGVKFPRVLSSVHVNDDSGYLARYFRAAEAPQACVSYYEGVFEDVLASNPIERVSLLDVLRTRQPTGRLVAIICIPEGLRLPAMLFAHVVDLTLSVWNMARFHSSLAFLPAVRCLTVVPFVEYYMLDPIDPPETFYLHMLRGGDLGAVVLRCPALQNLCIAADTYYYGVHRCYSRYTPDCVVAAEDIVQLVQAHLEFTAPKLALLALKGMTLDDAESSASDLLQLFDEIRFDPTPLDHDFEGDAPFFTISAKNAVGW